MIDSYFQGILPTTTTQMNEASRVLASTLVEFATASFEEFGDLSSEDKVRFTLIERSKITNDYAETLMMNEEKRNESH